MRRIAADERAETLELMPKICADTRRSRAAVERTAPRPGDARDTPRVELEMQADSELWVALARTPPPRPPPGLLDHQARARDDAVFVRLDHAAVDAAAVAEVVGVDNQVAHGRGECSTGTLGTCLTMNDAPRRPHLAVRRVRYDCRPLPALT